MVERLHSCFEVNVFQTLEKDIIRCGHICLSKTVSTLTF